LGGHLVVGTLFVVLVSAPLSPADSDTLGIVESNGYYFSAAFPSRSAESISNTRIGSEQHFGACEYNGPWGFIVSKILFSHVIQRKVTSSATTWQG
jgi:hypothetical protein